MATIRVTNFIEAQQAGNEIARAGRAQARTYDTDEENPNASGGIVEIGTTYAQLDVSSDITAAGYAYFENLDDTNFIEVGLEVGAAFEPMIQLDPGHSAILPLSTTAVFAQADTAAAQLRYLVLER